MGENFFFSDFEKFHGSLGGELTLKRKQGLHSSSGFNTHFCFCKQANTSLNCSSKRIIHRRKPCSKESDIEESVAKREKHHNFFITLKLISSVSGLSVLTRKSKRV